MLAYLSRYTHRIAIANSRLVAFNGARVTFKWKDYRARGDARYKLMTLAADEFIRRFLLHVLPGGFHRIRYYGFLGPRQRRTKLARCRELIRSPTSIAIPVATSPATDYRDRTEALTGISLRTCPACHYGQMIVIKRLLPVPRTAFSPDTS